MSVELWYVFEDPLILYFSFGVIGSLSAQKTISTAPIPFSISYYGDLFVHPGFKISADLKVYEFSKSKTKRSGKVKAITKSLIATPNLSNYWHVRSHTGLQAGIDILWRKAMEKVGIVKWDLEWGILVEITGEIHGR